jgi:hypothetical protein
VQHISGFPLEDRHLALLTKYKLAWTGLQGTNTLAYYDHLKIMHEKGIIILSPGLNDIKVFSSEIYECFQ